MVNEGGETMGDDAMVSADEASDFAYDATNVAAWLKESARRDSSDDLSTARLIHAGHLVAAVRIARTVIALWGRVRAVDDPAKDDTDEAHPAWWRGYNADKGELGHIASTAQAEARTARARVALIEAERDEARAKLRAAEAEVERLRAENATLRASTGAAVDGVRAMLPEALKVAREEGAAAMRSSILDVVPYITEHDKAIIAALPLDAPAEEKS
jgi:hypothetical protein